MLILLLDHCSKKKPDGKKDLFKFIDLNNFKIILTLLAKKPIVYMQIFILKVGELSLKKRFVRSDALIQIQLFNDDCINIYKLIT